MPHLIIIAGPNGAGKSTTAPALLKDALSIENFVNADVIAQGLCAYQPEKAAILIAAKINNNPVKIEQPTIWQNLMETYNDR